MGLYTGLMLSLPDLGGITVKAVLVCCTCDLPARAQVMSMVQFNGYYGCPCCLQKGMYLINYGVSSPISTSICCIHM